jgi:hypothetical protein
MDEKIIDKVKKLLRLGKSTNQNEAALAAAMAAELMAKHNLAIESIDLGTNEQVQVDAVVINSDTRKVYWRTILINGCAKSQGARCFVNSTRKWTSTGRMTTPEKTETIVVGTKSQTSAVKYLFEMLSKEIVRLAKKEWKLFERNNSWRDDLNARRWKHAFRIGCASTITHRLIEMFETVKQTSNETALVYVGKQETAIADFMSNIDLKPASRPNINDMRGMRSGERAGHSVALRTNKSLSAGMPSLMNQADASLLDD